MPDHTLRASSERKRALPRLLVVDDEITSLLIAKGFLASEYPDVDAISSPDLAREMLEQQTYDILITDMVMQECDGLQLIQSAKRSNPLIRALVMTAHTDVQAAIGSLKEGAYDFLQKPLTQKGLLNSVARAWRSVQDEREQLMLAAVVDQSHESVLIIDLEGTIEYVNPTFEQITGYACTEIVGQKMQGLGRGDNPEAFHRELWEKITRGETWNGIVTSRKKDGTLYQEKAIIFPVRDRAGNTTNYVSLSEDVTRQIALESQLRQAQKLESIGQLAAGIAHEINTPMQYISDNTTFLKRALGGLMEALQWSETLLLAVQEGTPDPDVVAQAQSALQKAKVAFLLKQVPRALDQSLEGLERVANLVSAMKEFSHPSQGQKQPLDLEHAIETTLTVARNEWKYIAEAVTDFDPALPPVPCLRDEFNQVILNLIVNAAHAISDVTEGGQQGMGVITLQTRLDGAWAEIRVSDTGTGIPADIKQKIFDPFFTTKEVGKGTGQGLAIAHSVVVDKHGGTLDIESEIGKGTTFIIRLPLDDDPTHERGDTG